MAPFSCRARLAALVPALTLVMTLTAARPSEAVKVMDWNLLNYPSASGSAREPYFRTVIQAVHPDVMVVEEVTGTTSAGMNQYLTNVLNNVFPGEYAAGTWMPGPDTNGACFYRTSVFNFVSTDTIGTTLRAIDIFTLKPVGYTSDAANLTIFAMHLKAGSTSADQTQRAEEATRLRNRANTFPAGSHFIYAGDFNIQSSTETSYQIMLASTSDNDGKVQDPINSPGSWNNNGAFALIHTQSPMGTNSYGGATGGIDDRFDFQLISTALADSSGMAYIPGTYRTYGNDGLHFNTTIDAAPTIPEGPAIATALANASDHMPVIQLLYLPARISTLASLDFGTVIVGASATQNLTVSNGATSRANKLNYSLAAPAGFTAPGGSFVAAWQAPANSHSITMLTATPGARSGNLVVTSDDLDNPTKNVGLSGTVLAHAVPSTAASPVAVLDTLDFGSHSPGGFADGSALVHNAGYTSLQALLDVYQASFSGPDAARFSIPGGFSTAQLGSTPATYGVHFDDSGAAAGSYTATLTFKTRDQQNLSGATNLSDVSWYLTARVSSQGAAPEIGVTPAVTRLIGNYPNPFNPLTTIAFDLAREAQVRLFIFDVRGRLIARLIDGPLGAGRYRTPWDGRDINGIPVGSGVYFYRLDTADASQTRTMTLMK